MSNLWAAEWHSKNRPDGKTRHLLYYRETCLPALFRTRRACREWIKKKYGYIATREDLRAEPHGWRMPQAIKVKVVKIESQ